MHNKSFPLKSYNSILPCNINIQLQYTLRTEVLLGVVLSCVGTFLR